MNDYALAKLLHNEYETRFSNPNTNEKVHFTKELRLISTFSALPVAIAIIATFLF